MARSLAVMVLTWVCLAVGALTGLPWLLLTGRMELIYAQARLSIRMLLALAGVKVRLEGLERLPPGAVVYMANHQSNLDPPILLAYLPGHLSFLAKRELFQLPLLGMVMRNAGLIPIDRRDRSAAAASLAQAASAVRGGRPFLVFPEGTRSPDGRLLPFKKGPFFMVEQSQAAIVPVAVSGTRDCLPRGSMRIHPGTVSIALQAAVLPEQWRDATDPRLAMAELVRIALHRAVESEPPEN